MLGMIKGVIVMNVGIMRFMSRALGHHVSYTISLPEVEKAGPGPYPVLLQLHGASDDHSMWGLKSNLLRYVSELPLIVIMPDGGLSFWIDFSPRERYETFIMQDLCNHINAFFPVKEGKMAIGGLSMGGYGCMHLALKYPERFASVWSHSGAMFSREDLVKAREDVENGDGPWSVMAQDLDDADLFLQAKRLKESGKQPPQIAFDCGTEDFLIEHNRRFHAHLEAIGLPHTYREHPGSHEWDYWDEHVKEALEQHCRALQCVSG